MLSRICCTTVSTWEGSESSTSMEAGSGFWPSNWSMMSGLMVVSRKSSSAWSFVVKLTEATSARPEIWFITSSMVSWEASSPTWAVMVTSFSMLRTKCSTITPPTRNTPMISSDRKMVMIEPSVVDKLRVSPWKDSFRK